MDPAMYSAMAAVEGEHWWFVARRRIVDSVIDRLPLPAEPAILEVGCGSGGNLAMLAAHGRVYAMDPEPMALKMAEARELAVVQPGHLPDQIPFGETQFDLIVLLDVLEHVAEDAQALRALMQRLKPDGWLLLTVPTFPWLWSYHDVAHHHHRRYTRPGLSRLAREAGFSVHTMSHFNFWLFPLVAAVRLAQKISGHQGSGSLSVPPRWLNRLLTAIFASERHILRRLSLPVGVSLLLCAKRTGNGRPRR